MNPANFTPMFVSSDPEIRIKKLENENLQLKAKLEPLQKMYDALLKTLNKDNDNLKSS